MGALERGREAFADRAWRAAYDSLAAADLSEADDLERLAIAATLLGRDDDAASAWERGHDACLAAGDRDRAARCAFWLAFGLLLRGESARAAGWLARAERVVADAGDDCVARGLLLMPAFLDALGSGDCERAARTAEAIVRVGERCGDPDVSTMGLLSRGEAAIAAGDVAGGTRFLDEAMVSVTAGHPSPLCAGVVYCAVIEACVAMLDIGRAAEWTDALHRWCQSQPDLVPFRGQCLVHRSQVQLAHGRWDDAARDADLAKERLTEPPHPALGLALYQRGEVLRLRGDLRGAEESYRAASACGHDPVPGLPLLRLAAGQTDVALAAARRLQHDSSDPKGRIALLAAIVEIYLAAGDVAAGRIAAGELGAMVDGASPPLARAVVAYARGSVALADGDAIGALPLLREAFAQWRDLTMPYDAARARVLIALACRAVGDHDAAELALDDARSAFERVGAAPDVARVDALRAPVRGSAVLTDRECEVLRLVATGRTNREIASELVISEHTVARHLQNTFLKLGLSSRTAAAAYAYEHGLVGQN